MPTAFLKLLFLLVTVFVFNREVGHTPEAGADNSGLRNEILNPHQVQIKAHYADSSQSRAFFKRGTCCSPSALMMSQQ